MTPVVALITARGDAAGASGALVERVRWAAFAGVHLIQVREPDLDGGPLVALVRRCVEAVRGSSARVLVNDRVDVALAAGAHGVHLRADSMPASRVRRICPPGFVVGRSVHGRDEAIAAAHAGALDYLLFGTVFATASKPGRTPAGPAALAGVVAATAVPVLAVGGVSPDNLDEVAATGAAGFAAIGLFAVDSADAMARTVAVATAAFARPRLSHVE